MRYKIVKKPWRYNHIVYDFYYIMKEVKRWYNTKPKWKHVYENTYSGLSKVKFNDLNKAEDYIKKMILADNINLNTEDIKIYETREKIIDKLLENE